ncbi:MAG: AAA family ATPase [Spirochaetales bacterium]
MSRSSNNLNDFVLLTEKKGVDIIASSLFLVDLRGLSEKRLSQLIPTLDDYDFVIIDTQPTYDNLVLNAYYPADFIITPIHLSLFDFNTAKFLQSKMQTEVGKHDNWYLHVNGFNHRFEDSKAGNQREYLELFKNEFDNITPVPSWFPWTANMRQIIDRNMFLAKKEGVANSICNEQLHASVCSLAECFFEDGENFPLVDCF